MMVVHRRCMRKMSQVAKLSTTLHKSQVNTCTIGSGLHSLKGLEAQRRPHKQQRGWQNPHMHSLHYLVWRSSVHCTKTWRYVSIYTSFPKYRHTWWTNDGSCCVFLRTCAKALDYRKVAECLIQILRPYNIQWQTQYANRGPIHVTKAKVWLNITSRS